MSDQHIPVNVENRLKDDNQYVGQRIGKLVPMLIGVNKKKAIKRVTEKSKKDYSKKGEVSDDLHNEYLAKPIQQ